MDEGVAAVFLDQVHRGRGVENNFVMEKISKHFCSAPKVFCCVSTSGFNTTPN